MPLVRACATTAPQFPDLVQVPSPLRQLALSPSPQCASLGLIRSPRLMRRGVLPELPELVRPCAACERRCSACDWLMLMLLPLQEGLARLEPWRRSREACEILAPP